MRQRAELERIELREREAEAARPDAQARMAKAEARDAEAARLTAEARDRAERLNEPRAAVEDRFRRADRIDPDVKDDGGARPRSVVR